MKIGIATCLTLPEEDVDETITLEAFRRHGHDTEMVAWEDPSVDFGAYDAMIVRSTWNYPEVPEQFADWIRDTATKTKLLNPPEIMLGNLNKRYLRDLVACGVSVVPGQWIWPTEAAKLREILTQKSVVKPSIGAGSWDTKVFLPGQVEEAVEWLGSHEPHREFMVQPFVASVDTVGEQSIVVIGGEPSHRIHKRPRFHDGDESVEGPFEVEPELADIAQRCIKPFRDQILYARVDLMMAHTGEWMVSELELIEPSLFFRQKPEALDTFVRRAEQLLGL